MITRYEITACKDDVTYLIGYTPRISRMGLLTVMQSHGPAIIEKLGIGNNDAISFACKPRIHAKMDGWTIGFTGRTQREAQYLEHEYIKNIEHKAPDMFRFIPDEEDTGDDKESLA